MAELMNNCKDEEKDEEKERLSPGTRREAQSETVGKQLEEIMAEWQLLLGRTMDGFQQLTECAAEAYQEVTLGLIIAKAENDTSRPRTQRVNWNEVAQRIFARITQLGVLQCAMEPKINFLQTGNRMRSVYDVLTQLYQEPRELLQKNFLCNLNNNKEANKQSRPTTETKTIHYDETMEKLVKQERQVEEEKTVKQEENPLENEMNIMRSWAENTKEKNEGRQKTKSTVVIVPKDSNTNLPESFRKADRPIKKRCRFCKKRGHTKDECLERRSYWNWKQDSLKEQGKPVISGGRTIEEASD